ncbi:tetratricopeptide repeat protein [Altererythrobacter sp.]|uniref:tetratricopeptide repeat protein n=1 Tax=Altererythrobacter sp. TaxID=1872480 RepID=UPI001B03B88C|nr:tetratricopeptide repeat protein [Altererythrobacter sp.]MBO6946126.1 tetratricopeptide repeat protein [Altererythrobacter sp.]
MTEASVLRSDTAARRVFRWVPAAAALALVVFVTGSVGSMNSPADPRAVAMVELGRDAFNRGDKNAAIDAFEAALALDPGYNDAFIALADATRAQGLTAKSIDYYRSVLDRDPINFAALAGEGQALTEKGAIEEARRNLAVLHSMCGANCPETIELKAAIVADSTASLAADNPEAGPASN